MAPLLAAATGIWAFVFADVLLEALIKKTTEAGIDDAAKLIADLRKDKRKQKRLGDLRDAAWQEWARIECEAEGSEEAVHAAYERAEDLQAAIEGNPGVQGLAENPLLLTIIALVNWRGRKLPDRRVELYQHAAETLIESWPFTQRGVRLPARTVMGLLAPVAYRIFARRGSEELDETTLQPLLVRAIRERQGCSAGEAGERAAELLPQITEQSGIFVERGRDPQGRRYYGFLHQTFAEYFAARHLAARWPARGPPPCARR